MISVLRKELTSNLSDTNSMYSLMRSAFMPTSEQDRASQTNSFSISTASCTMAITLSWGRGFCNKLQSRSSFVSTAVVLTNCAKVGEQAVNRTAQTFTKQRLCILEAAKVIEVVQLYVAASENDQRAQNPIFTELIEGILY